MQERTGSTHIGVVELRNIVRLKILWLLGGVGHLEATRGGRQGTVHASRVFPRRIKESMGSAPFDFWLYKIRLDLYTDRVSSIGIGG